MKGQRSDMNLRAVEQERELKRQRTPKACEKQSSWCSNQIDYFDIRRGKSKQRQTANAVAQQISRVHVQPSQGDKMAKTSRIKA